MTKTLNLLLTLPLLLCFLAAPELLYAQGSTTSTDTSTSPTPRVVKFRAMGDLQVDVWLNGDRAGITPFNKKLVPGEYLLTAMAEGIQPISQVYTVEDKDNMLANLPVAPLTQDNYEIVKKYIVQLTQKLPGNSHPLIMALFTAMDSEEKSYLFTQIDKVIQDDPIVNIIRARYFLDIGRETEALELTEKSLEEYPELAFAWRTHAIVLLQQGRFDEALDAANYAVILEPNAWRNLRIRAVVYSKIGDLRKGTKDAERASEIFAQFQKSNERTQ